MLQESSPSIAKFTLALAEPTPYQTSASSALQFLRKSLKILLVGNIMTDCLLSQILKATLGTNAHHHKNAFMSDGVS